MDKIDNELPKLKKLQKVSLLIIGIIFIILFGGAFYILRSIQIEEYCAKQAKDITGDKHHMLVEPNEEELQRYPNLIHKGDRITKYYRKFLDCSLKQKPFYFF